MDVGKYLYYISVIVLVHHNVCIEGTVFGTVIEEVRGGNITQSALNPRHFLS